jgi:iron complex outermembrane receptor protein
MLFRVGEIMNNINSLFSGAAVCALTIALSAPVLAQDGGDAAADGPIDTIIVTGQRAQEQVVSDGALGALGDLDALEAPFNVSTYTAQLVLDQQAQTLGDVFENDPTIRTTFGFGNQSEQFVIRGFPLYGDDVAIDGLFGITPRQLVSPELYENVQVLNGANAFLFGAAPGGSGIGGGVNLTPKRARAEPLVRVTGTYTGDSILGGAIDAGKRFGADAAFGARVNGVYRVGEAAIDDEQRSAKVAGASFDFSSGPTRIFLDLGYELQEAEQARPVVQIGGGLTDIPEPPKASANYAQPWSFTRLEDIYGMFRAEYDLTDDILVYAAGGFRDGSEDGDYSSLTLTDGATGAAEGSRLYVPREDNNQAGTAGIRAKFRTGGLSHKLNAGASLAKTENRNAYAFGNFPAELRTCASSPNSFRFCTNLYDPAIVEKPEDQFAAGDYDNPPVVSKGEFTSLFVSDTIGALDDRLLVTVGMRHQQIEVSNFNRTSGAVTDAYDEQITTPVAGVVFRPTDNLSLYANRIEGLAQGPTAPNDPNITNPGEVFSPFRSVQYEAGIKYQIRSFTATLAAYEISQPSAYTVLPAGGGLGTYVVDGEQRNRGLELTLNGEPTEWLRFIGGLAYTDAELVNTEGGANDGNRAVGVPEFQTNLGVEVMPAFMPNAIFTGRLVHTGKQAVNATNTLEIPGWTRLDLGMRYILVAGESPITLRANVENVTGESYWASSFGGYLVQGGPRTLRMSVTYEF